MTDIDLSLILSQQDAMMRDISSLRDDSRVSTAILMRIDGTISSLVNEIRSTHAQMSRIQDRLRKLEEKVP